MPKRLLRSIIDIGGSPSSENLRLSFKRLADSGLEWPKPADKSIYKFVLAYFQHHLECPSLIVVQDYFRDKDDVEVIERLQDIVSAEVYDRTNFIHLLQSLLDEQNKIKAVAALKEAQDIATKGITFGQGKFAVRKQGIKDAIVHATEALYPLVIEDNTAQTRGDVRLDTRAGWDEYQTAKLNKDKAYGRFTGLDEIDSVCHGHKKGELWLHAAFTGELKCLPGDATVFDHRTQRRRRFVEMFDCGDLPIISALEHEGQSNRIVLVTASHLIQNGNREVFDLTLNSGRMVGATANHKFLTPDGWKELGDLEEGDFVATPKHLRAEGSKTYTAAEVKLIGYLIGDGRVQDCINFTQENERIRNDFVSCLLDIGLIEGAADYEKPSFSIQFPPDRTPYVRVSHGLGDRWHRVTSPVRVLLERLGLYGTNSYEKRIPSEFFGLSEDMTAVLLGALWSTDGSCSTGDYLRTDHDGKAGGLQSSYTISYTSVSHGLCLDIQSLLLRLGIQSTVTFVDTEVSDRPYRFWVVRVVTNPSKALFCSQVRVLGKEDSFALVASRIPDRDTTLIPASLLPDEKRIQVNGYWRYTSNHKGNGRDVVTAEIASKFGVDTGDIYWDRVRSVVTRGIEMTYDLSVPEHHTFITNDIVTHNSTFAMNWSYNLVTRYRSNVLYVSLEMPYVQIRRLLYTIHTANKQFEIRGIPALDYRKVRDGDLSPTEEVFFQQTLDDLRDNPEYCSLELWCPDRDVTIPDIRTYAEIMHKKKEIGLLVIDHGGLVEPTRKNFKEYTIALNSVLRDSKKLALQFNHGEGIPVLMLFQLNRTGKAEADKAEGRYKMSAISYANEAERSSDVITTTYLNDQHRDDETTVFCNLKNRDNPLFKPFLANVSFNCRRIRNVEQDAPGMSVMDPNDMNFSQPGEV